MLDAEGMRNLDHKTGGMTRQAKNYKAKADCRMGRHLGLPKLAVGVWRVLIALDANGGTLPRSMTTVAGAHVEERSSRLLAQAGYVTVEQQPTRLAAEYPETLVTLTAEGRGVLALVRDKRLVGKP